MPENYREIYLRHVDKVITPRDYSDAIMVQSAPNLCAIARSFADVMVRINRENMGDEWRNHHPIVILYTTQILWLATGSVMPSSAQYSEAHAVCEARSEVAKEVGSC